MSIRYTHTNIVAKDWKRLVAFYEKILNCKPLFPERDLSGEWLDKATAITGARIKGMHLRLPGYDDNSPTLEIFQYDSLPNITDTDVEIRANKPGFAHIAFAVDDVHLTAKAVLEAGGCEVGELIETRVEGVGLLTMQYLADPEGNIIELQKWT